MGERGWRLHWCRMPQPAELEPLPSGHPGSLLGCSELSPKLFGGTPSNRGQHAPVSCSLMPYDASDSPLIISCYYMCSGGSPHTFLRRYLVTCNGVLTAAPHSLAFIHAFIQVEVGKIIKRSLLLYQLECPLARRETTNSPHCSAKASQWLGNPTRTGFP